MYKISKLVLILLFVSTIANSQETGSAIIPEKNWNEMTEDEALKAFNGPHPEKVITQAIRQKEFDNFSTTDDHFMHITGIAKDQSGNKYYITKNSWGKKGDKDGFVYLSEQSNSPQFYQRAIFQAHHLSNWGNAQL